MAEPFPDALTDRRIEVREIREPRTDAVFAYTRTSPRLASSRNGADLEQMMCASRGRRKRVLAAVHAFR